MIFKNNKKITKELLIEEGFEVQNHFFHKTRFFLELKNDFCIGIDFYGDDFYFVLSDAQPSKGIEYSSVKIEYTEDVKNMFSKIRILDLDMQRFLKNRNQNV